VHAREEQRKEREHGREVERMSERGRGRQGLIPSSVGGVHLLAGIGNGQPSTELLAARGGRQQGKLCLQKAPSGLGILQGF
jgi:hypothetical protein